MAYDMSVLGSESASSLIVTASFADHDAVPPRDVLAPIKKFADLGAHGGLSGPGLNPAEAQVAIVAAELSPDGLARWRLSAERVAPEAIDMLLGSVAFIDAKIARLRSVVVEAPRALTQSRDRPTPGYYRPTPF